MATVFTSMQIKCKRLTRAKIFTQYKGYIPSENLLMGLRGFRYGE